MWVNMPPDLVQEDCPFIEVELIKINHKQKSLVFSFIFCRKVSIAKPLDYSYVTFEFKVCDAKVDDSTELIDNRQLKQENQSNGKLQEIKFLIKVVFISPANWYGFFF